MTKYDNNNLLSLYIKNMKKIIFMLIIFSLFISSCWTKVNKDEKIIYLNKKIEELTIKLEKTKKKEELEREIELLSKKINEASIDKTPEELQKELAKKEEAISKLKLQAKELMIKNRETENKEKEKTEIPKEKILDIKFYAQAINWNFDPPYLNFCEEASILNWYYYLVWKRPSLSDYDKDLWKMKKYEDKNFEWWYRHTSLQESKKLLKAFQWENEEVFAEIIENPTIEIIKENIAKWNPILIPTYWKWLKNIHFTWGWATYHNLLIKWYKDDIFVTNEVWTSRWNNYEYNQKLIIDNIFNYDPKLFPNRFKEGKKEIMILYKK